ncbi:hypothetical protein MLD38_015642 [Melastoma candidum]|uniref:Uncharacterized protein n=1 Tax=Melastoma candidum TaxID=119954 RepID=A0ACB9RGY2_9MYRT|nr:hypothetical protein MLD38_015642 [Melastoma candidum]
MERRKVKFPPKAPARKKPRPVSPKREEEDADVAAAEAQLLLQRFNDSLPRRRSRAERTASVQVAFGECDPAASASIDTYSVPRDKTGAQGSRYSLRSADAARVRTVTPSDTEESAMKEELQYNVTPDFPRKTANDYRAPWDYHHTTYPTSLPLRMPFSGNPEVLDEAEFGEGSGKSEIDEGNINAASELGLLDESEKGRMLLFQLPPNLPLVKRTTGVKGKELPDSATWKSGASNKGCSLEDLGGGYMGKLLIYKSGVVKFKMGETLYDVSPGSDCIFSQNVAAINTRDKHFCALGELRQRAIVTPDIDSLLNSVIDLD